MASICYYSNFCAPSKKLLQLLSRTKLQNDVHFICVDKRTTNANGQTVIDFEGQKLLLPPPVIKVPALFLIGPQQVLFEDDIYSYLNPKEKEINQVATNFQGEPECYSNQFTGMSDAYSFLDQSPDELGTKGDGGMRQIRSFVPVEGTIQIPTPPEDYEPDKVGKNGSKSLEEYRAERELAVAAPPKRV
jgi:hypothetical protein